MLQKESPSFWRVFLRKTFRKMIWAAFFESNRNASILCSCASTILFTLSIWLTTLSTGITLTHGVRGRELILSGAAASLLEGIMGIVCSRRSVVERNSHLQSGSTSAYQQAQLDPLGSQSPLYKMLTKVPAAAAAARMDEMQREPNEFDGQLSPVNEDAEDSGDRNKLARVFSEKARSARSRTTFVARKGAAKVNEVGSLLGRAGTASLGKAVEALDTLGSSMTNLNLGSGFSSGAAQKGNKIGILAFEVANTIAKGYHLKQSLSEESIKMLKEDVLCSEGVQRLVSTDMAELSRIAAADKRKELIVFAGEVVRFGNHCRDPQWHQLDRFFDKLGTEVTVPRQNKEEAEAEMQNLVVLAQYTAELYHELNSLDRFESDMRRKVQEEELLNNSQRGDSLAILRSELKSQKKHVNSLKKRSLWSKILEEVTEKLVDIVYFLHQEIQNAFGDAGENSFDRKESARKGASPKLGTAGLALHYASIINQIDSLVSRPSSIPVNTRDNLYQGLPVRIKGSLRHRLLNFPIKEELTIAQIKAEMEKILTWLVPIATNTTKAHHGFGWVGEWANTGSAIDQRLPGQAQIALIQTLHHADQRVTEDYLLELIVWLHHLVSLARSNVPSIKSPIRSPLQPRKSPPREDEPAATGTRQHVVIPVELSPEDQNMLKDVSNRKFIPGISKSQEFDTKSRAGNASRRLMKSSSHSPSTSAEDDSSLGRCHANLVPLTDFEIDKVKALDVIDNI